MYFRKVCIGYTEDVDSPNCCNHYIWHNGLCAFMRAVNGDAVECDDTSNDAVIEVLSSDDVPPCIVCGKVWHRKDVAEWCYHKSRGVVCRNHPGVKEWYDELLAKA